MKNFFQKFLQKKFRRIPGFSLIEILVAIVVSGIVLSAVMTSYVSLTQTSRKIDLSRQLQREMNFAMIRIGDRIRSHPIDFLDKKCKNSASKLCLKNLTIEFSEGNLGFENQPLFSEIFAVENATFALTPSTDPGSFGKTQPRVKIILEVGSAEKNHVKIPPLLLQTTISSRTYQ